MLESKRDILKVKHEQTLEEMNNCTKMQEICHNLMPPSQEKVQENVIVDCLDLACNFSESRDKRKVKSRFELFLFLLERLYK